MTMSLESPTRLKHGELGRIIEAADAAMAPERIASNHAAIKAAIAAGVGRTWPLWFKLGLPLLLVTAGYLLYRGVGHEAAPVREVIVVTPPPDASVAEDAAIVDDAAIDAAEVPIDAPPKKAKVAIAAPPPDAAPPEPPPSDLPAQIALYEEARAAAAKNELARGIDLLDELLRRFPSTQLRAEAELTRAELLTRTNRLADAAAALEALVASGAHRGRRGELLRALGDVRRKQGDCPRAIEAYTRAREMKLHAAEIVKVERGLERCAPPK
jgi:tetratricopeptide (TPR) repeat protein